MGLLAFVLFWVLLAIALVFIGISGGPGGARERLHTQSRTGRRISFVGFAVVLAALGIGVPAAVLAAANRPAAAPEAGVKEFTEQESRGRELFAEQCGICHTLKATNSVATVGPNLDTLRPTKGLVLDAIENGRARGNGAMAADLVTGEDAESVSAFVAKAVGQTGK